MHYLNNTDTDQHVASESYDEEDIPALVRVADLFAYTVEGGGVHFVCIILGTMSKSELTA
jgi:hypothetical protein